jgi:hypothetical protein
LKKRYIAAFVVLFLAGLSLRLSALSEQYSAVPEGNDGSLEFQVYAEHLLDYTLQGERFPPGTVMHKPVLSMLLAGVFSVLGRSAYVQYATTLALSMGQLLLLFVLVRRFYGAGWALAAVALLAINAEGIYDAVQGTSVAAFVLVLLALLWSLVGWRCGTGSAWLVGGLALLMTQTREEGWFLFVMMYAVLVWTERGRLMAWLRSAYPLLLLPVLGGLLHGLFRWAAWCRCSLGRCACWWWRGLRWGSGVGGTGGKSEWWSGSVWLGLECHWFY